ncbi:MAG: quinolinate synthase NadA [Candidatus Cloacimonetes bacterium]|nr:quinolinate synthase NadA [Candidatus Cloacimonadota bacterium]
MNKFELQSKILKLKEEKQAIILAHNYQILAVQEIADFIGDSLQLSQVAADLKQELVVFCGVQFMAETAKLLKPEAKVLLPVLEAGCPMADMITGEQLRSFKALYDNPVVVCYVNSSIEVKAESDICCTSGNALKVINSIPADKNILFVPDRNLGSYAAQQTGRKIVLWQGYCNVHERISAADVRAVKEKYPGYKLIVHPECRPDVIALADFAASTKGMIDYVADHDNVIVGTETGLYDQLQARYPEKNLAPISESNICINMKKTRLEDVLRSLEREEFEITIATEIAARALSSVEKMLRIK